MSRRGLYLAVGFLWGLLLAVIVGGAVSAVAAGAAWIWLFGDDSWPEWANWAIVGSGIGAGLITFLACMFIARIVANRQGGQAEEQEAGGGSALAWLLILLAVAGAGGYGWYQYDLGIKAEQAAAQELAATQYFDDLQLRTHRSTAIAIDWPGGGLDGSAAVTLEGTRAGAYRLEWQLRNGLFAKPVMQGADDLELAAGPRNLEISLRAAELVDGYRKLLERQDENILVDEPFLFETRLTPRLTAEEENSLPPQVARNLAQGISPLIDATTTEFHVRFHLYGDTPSWGGLPHTANDNQ